VQLTQRDLARLHQAHDLFVMDQLFPGQARHHIDQVNMAVILSDQAQGSAGGLEFAVLVVDQQGFLIGQRGLDPGVRGGATEEFVDFGQVHRAHGQGSQKVADYTDRAADHQPLALMCINMTSGGQQL